jgi:molybdopterin-dependent oxidoreductase alpha subunit
MDDPDQQRDDTVHSDSPAGGWGSLEGIARVLTTERPTIAVLDTLRRQNKPRGHMCTSCAWAKPADPHLFEFCENGAKATIWDLTRDRCGPEFFAEHTLSDLRGWSDHELEKTGRLTHPMRFDAGADRYVPTTWEEAFAGIGATLRGLDPKSTVFYSSGRASLETSYLYALFARVYGHNNLPDSSNMCHETTSVGLKKVIGSSVGTCVLSDFESCDMMLFVGQNTGSNSPRFLHPIQDARRRGCKIVTFNPIREKGLVEFVNPQNPAQMLTGADTVISDIYLQVRPGADIAALLGVARHLFELDDARGDVIDRAFVAEHTDGLAAFEAKARGAEWDEIEAESGLGRDDLRRVAEIYARSERVIGIYGMGLTQHVGGSESVGMLVNLLLLRGNIGRDGAGICPVRGHSNVQGQRTVGISEKPELVPLDKLATLFDFAPPRDKGIATVEVVEGVLDGSVHAFIGLGGNFSRAIPDTERVEPAWAGLDLTVQIATKLNRSHLLPGRAAWLLPCLVRAEEDAQASGPQAVTMEDSLSHVHGSIGRRAPASDQLLSEVAIVAGIAEATTPPNPRLKWREWVGDYGLIRDLIAATYPDEFHDFNDRMFTPGGFYRGNAARDRTWKTDSGKAEFTTPEGMNALGRALQPDEMTLVTLRSNDQFNTTIYGFHDRLRGIDGCRDVVLINPEEARRLGLSEEQRVTLRSATDDGVERVLGGLRLVLYDLPDGCVGAYYPEANGLVPLALREKLSHTPAYKGAPVRVTADPAG